MIRNKQEKCSLSTLGFFLKHPLTPPFPNQSKVCQILPETSPDSVSSRLRHARINTPVILIRGRVPRRDWLMADDSLRQAGVGLAEERVGGCVGWFLGGGGGGGGKKRQGGGSKALPLPLSRLSLSLSLPACAHCCCQSTLVLTH